MKINLKNIKKIPIIGSVFIILNSYAYQGDIKASYEVAPIRSWLHRYISIIIASFTISYLTISTCNNLELNFSPSSIITGIFPSILGFGIGVFALSFSIPQNLVNLIEEQKKIKKIEYGSRILVIDMAYPLISYALILLSAVILLPFEVNYPKLKYASAFLLYYGILLTIELILSIYNTAMVVTTVKINEFNNKKEDE